MNISEVMNHHLREKTITNLVRALLVCGILSSALRVATDILAAMWYPGYSYLNQTMSQLAAIGAPTRAFQIPLLTVWCVLVIAFGIGVWVSAGQKRSLRIAGVLLVMLGVFGLLPVPGGSMDLRGKGATNTLHIVVEGVDALVTVLFIVFGAVAQGKSFRLYSMVTIVIFLVFGALMGVQASHVDAHFSAPWMGAIERVIFYSYLLWILVFAIVRLRVFGKEPSVAPSIFHSPSTA